MPDQLSYLRVGEPGRTVHRTVDVDGTVLVDVDDQGSPVGIEVLVPVVVERLNETVE